MRFATVVLLLITSLPISGLSEAFHVSAYFEPNAEQDRHEARFVFQGGRWAAVISGKGIVFDTPTQATRLSFVKARDGGQSTGANQQPGVSNYFTGNDRDKWRVGVPHFGAVRFEAVYKGIDVVFHESTATNQRGELEYDFIVAPGANPQDIEMKWEGVTKLTLDPSGSLRASTDAANIIVKKPSVYQETAGRKVAVRAAYLITAGGTLRIALGPYDRRRSLVIDPVVVYSTYLSAQPLGLLDIAPVAVDSSGNVLTAQNLPTATHGRQIQILKLDPSGSVLLSSTLFGSPNADTWARSLVLDGAGNIYIAGRTNSSDFPVVNALQPMLASPGAGFPQNIDDGFVTKISADGRTILYSTYLGGSGSDDVIGIAVDSAGAVYGAVGTTSTNFPSTAGSYRTTTYGREDTVIFKMNAAGNQLIYATYFGGSGDDIPHGFPAIAVDGIGNAYFSVSSTSGDLPITTGPFGVQQQGTFRPVIAKLNVTGTALLYCTYLGGENEGGTEGIAVDEAGHVYLGGTTASTNLRVTTGAFLTHARPVWLASDPLAWYVGFVTKFNSAATGLLFSSYTGLASNAVRAVVLHPSGSLLIAGRGPASFPGPAAIGENVHAFAAVMNPAGTAMTSQVFGGSANDTGNGIALGHNGRVYVAGSTQSPDFITTSGALHLQGIPGAQTTGFLSYLDGFDVPASCVTSLSADGSPFEPQGGMRRISVTAPPDCVWYATASLPFIQITQGTSGTGSGSVTINVGAKASSDTLPGVGYVSFGPLMTPVIQLAQLDSQNNGPYDDIHSSDPFAGYVAVLAKHLELSAGGHMFGPNLPVTRRLMARTLILSVLGTDNFPSPVQPYFTDVATTDPDFRYVQKLREIGITNGCAADRFCPEDIVTRGQMAAFLSRSLLGNGFTAAPTPYFGDVPSVHLFYRNVQKIRDWGITAGCTANTYCPNDAIVKWQLAVFLVRAFFTPR